MRTYHELLPIEGKVLHLREIQGLTLEEVGRIVKRSKERVRQMQWKAKRVLRRKAEGNPMHGLSVRALNALDISHIYDVQTLRQKLAEGFDLSRLRNIGKKTIAEIQALAASKDF